LANFFLKKPFLMEKFDFDNIYIATNEIGEMGI
jgi:hypothetical protein